MTRAENVQLNCHLEDGVVLRVQRRTLRPVQDDDEEERAEREYDVDDALRRRCVSFFH